MPTFSQSAKSVEGYIKHRTMVWSNFYGGMGQIENKCWKKNHKSETIVANVLEVLIDDEEATLAQLNRIYGLNYDVFSHVWIPKRRIPINMLVDVLPNVENEDLIVGNAGVNI